MAPPRNQEALLSTGKQYLLLCLLSGYLLLDYGFMQLRLPPARFGVPIGELVLLFMIFTINSGAALRKMGATINLLPLLLWWGFGFFRLSIDGANRGIWSFRDATQLIESLFIIVGFAVAGSPAFMDRFLRWLPWLIGIAAIYSLGFPFQTEINALSPWIGGASDEAIPVIGTYATTGTILLWAAFWFILADATGKRGAVYTAIACLLISFAVLVVQTRTIYFQFLGLCLISLIFRRRACGRLVMAIPVMLLVLFIITNVGLVIPGRLTDKMSFSFLIDHLQTVFGQGGNLDGNIGLAARGVDLRFGWWESVYRQVTGDTVLLLTGLGYGVPLTNFYDNFGDLVREPHNSFISIAARLGVLGFAAWFLTMVELFAALLRARKKCRQLGWRSIENLLLMILAFAALILIAALGEDALEKPYNAIPLYCFWGIALRIAYTLRGRPVHVTVTETIEPETYGWNGRLGGARL